MSTNDNDNDHANNNNNNIIFTIKDIKLYDSVVTLLASDNQKLSRRLSKGFERSVYWNAYKTKSENRNATNKYRYFLESNRLFVLIYTNQDVNSKWFKTQRYYLLEGIIDNYSVIINEKNFCDQLFMIDSDIKQYEEIRKLTRLQGEDYTTGCLLDYD